jgi:hypothetical protein
MRYRVKLINRLLAAKEFQTAYLEIGCYRDSTFSKVYADVKVGVDPRSGGTVRMTSDEFFLGNQQRFDIVFIDGLHRCEQVLRDVENSLHFLNPGGVILLHDCLPQAPEHQLRDRLTRSWNGDVWRAILKLREDRKIDTAVIDADQGMGIVVPRANTSVLDIDRHIDFEGLTDSLMRLIGPGDVDAFLALDGRGGGFRFGAVWYRHILVTTFDVGTLDPYWLHLQLQLFERFTLPSVAGQSIRRFEWIMQVDVRIPGFFRSKLEALESGGLFTIVWTGDESGGTGVFPETQRHIAGGGGAETHILLSRLDPGDSLMRDFILMLQCAVLPGRSPEFLSFPRGSLWAAGKTYDIHHARNAFQTYVGSAAATLRMASGAECTPAGRSCQVREIEPDRPMWMQTAHCGHLRHLEGQSAQE